MPFALVLVNRNQKLTANLASVSSKLRDLQELIREKDHVIEVPALSQHLLFASL